MNLKQKVYNHCLKLVTEKIEELKHSMEDVTEGLTNDSKSSAGDKYETSRAMAQQEQEKTAVQLNEALAQKEILEKLDINVNSPKIIKGSLVKTNTVTLFISVALGRITIDNTSVMVISPQSPLGAVLMGLKKKDIPQINGIKYSIESIE